MDDPIARSTRAPGHRSFVATLAGCGLTLAAGIAAGFYGHSLPVFSVHYGVAQQASMAWCTDDGGVDDAAGDRYLAMFTTHYAWVDAGIGLVLSALTVAGLVFILRYQAPDDAWLRTPRRRWPFLALGVAAIAWTWWIAMVSLRIDLKRAYFPTCADSIIIPMYELSVLTLWVAPMLIAIGFAITRFFGPLPVALTEWDGSRPVRSWIVSGVLLILMLAVGTVLVMAIPTSSSWAVPGFVIALYLLASTRAALLSPKRRDAAEDCR